MTPNHHIPRFSLFSIVFAFVALADLMAVAMYPSLRWLTKPLIMISLLLYYLLSSRKINEVKSSFCLALIAALMGDIFLLFSDPQFFLFGLSSFLIMQLLYIFNFFKDTFQLNSLKILAAVLMMLLLFFFMNTLWSDLGDMAIPVSIYSFIIVLMSISALLRSHRSQGYIWVLVGSILFIISDGFIAWNKFMTPVAYGGLIVMSTYILAQYLIVMGILKYDYSTKSE